MLALVRLRVFPLVFLSRRLPLVSVVVSLTEDTAAAAAVAVAAVMAA